MSRAAALALVALLGCGEGLQFRRDERLRFVAPPERARVQGPIEVRWSIDPRAFRTGAPDGSSDRRRGFFGVFVDRTPMRPGEGIDALAEEDRFCEARTGCPDRAWLRRNGIHLTVRPVLRLPALPVDGGQDLGDVRRHEITVVLLDGRGRRIGEAAWTRTLLTRDEAP